MTDAADSAATAAGTSPDLSGWEDPPRAAGRDTAPVLSVDGYAGPLDWLLEMVRAKQLDLARLPIGALITQFAGALATALASRDVRQVERWAGWTVMAATLTELRSRLLLPVNGEASRAAEAEAEALRRRLLDRARMRQAADWLERRPQLGREVFRRGAPEANASGRGADITDLLRACLVALIVPAEQAAAYRPRPPPFWRVTDAIPHLRRWLDAVSDGGPLAAFLPAIDGDDPGRTLRCRAAVASTLVAGLELARDGAVTLAQDAAWMDIHVRRRDDHGAGPVEAAAAAGPAPTASPVPRPPPARATTPGAGRVDAEAMR